MSKINKNDLWPSDFGELFKTVFEQSFVGMAILDAKGIFIKVNPKACHVWEYKEEELIGKSWKTITHPEDIEKSVNYVQSYIENPFNANVIEKRYISGLNNIKHCKITTSILLNKNKIKYFVTQIDDITGKVSAIESIQKGISYLRAINKENKINEK